jgi:hypothetical protein
VKCLAAWRSDGRSARSTPDNPAGLQSAERLWATWRNPLPPTNPQPSPRAYKPAALRLCELSRSRNVSLRIGSCLLELVHTRRTTDLSISFTSRQYVEKTKARLAAQQLVAFAGTWSYGNPRRSAERMAI